MLGLTSHTPCSACLSLSGVLHSCVPSSQLAVWLQRSGHRCTGPCPRPRYAPLDPAHLRWLQVLGSIEAATTSKSFEHDADARPLSQTPCGLHLRQAMQLAAWLQQLLSLLYSRTLLPDKAGCISFRSVNYHRHCKLNPSRPSCSGINHAVASKRDMARGFATVEARNKSPATFTAARNGAS